HIRQLRTALEGALTALHLPTGGYAHRTLYANSSLIYAIDFQELRDQIRNAWNSGTGGVDLRWLMTDQLGTPRMVFDLSGSLTTMSRHDYLPFGEELGVNVGGRTAQQGYGSGDGVRQHFTDKERDNETGLDSFGARYFASTQGRFTSPDPVVVTSARMVDPQQFNLYSYVRNKPLALLDPEGREIWILFEDVKANGKHFSNRVRYIEGKVYTKDGKEYTGSNSYVLKVQNGLNTLAKGDSELNRRIEVLSTSKQVHKIEMTDLQDQKGDRNTPN